MAPRSVRGTDILHRCDTLPGSSGSPIFAFGSGAVIGVHYAGSASPTPGSYTFAKRLSAIAKDSRIIAALVREAEERKRRKDMMSAAERERERRAMEAKLRAELEDEMRKRLAMRQGAMRDELEAELRAKMEDELRRRNAASRGAMRDQIEAELRAKLEDELRRRNADARANYGPSWKPNCGPNWKMNVAPG